MKLGFGGTAGEMARLVNESGVMGESFEATAENVKDIPFDQLIEAIHVTQNELGITGTTAIEASETVSGSFGAMKAAAQNLLAGLGSTNSDVRGMMADLSETISIFVNNVLNVLGTIWDNLPLEDWQKWIGVVIIAAGPLLTVIGLIVKASGFLVGAFGAISSAFGAFSLALSTGAGGFAALKAGFAALMGPVGWVTLAIVGLIAIGVLLWKNWDTIKAKAIETWGSISGYVMPVIDAIKNFIVDTWTNLSAWWTENQEGIKNTIINAWNAIMGFLMPIVQVIADFIQATWSVVVAWWTENQEAMKEMVDTVWNAIQSIFDSVISLIVGIVEMGLAKIQQFWDQWGTVITTIVEVAWALIKNVFSGTLNNILTIVSTVIEQIKIIFQFAMDFIQSLVNTVLAFIRGDWEGVLDGIMGMASAFGTFIGDTFENMMNTAKELVSNGIEAVTSFFDQLWDIDLAAAGRAIIDGFLSGLTSAYENVKGFIGGIATWIAKNKGPISYDKKLLINNGEAIMQSLNTGLSDKFKDVKRNISSMAGIMSTAFSDANSMGGRLNNALASSVSGSYAMTANGQLSINQQPAYITFNLGNEAYTGFVEDITNKQDKITQLEIAYL